MMDEFEAMAMERLAVTPPRPEPTAPTWPRGPAELWDTLPEATDEHSYLKRHGITMPIPGVNGPQPRVMTNGQLVFMDESGLHGEPAYLGPDGRFSIPGLGCVVWQLWAANSDGPTIVSRDFPSALAIRKATGMHVVIPADERGLMAEGKGFGGDDYPIVFACDLGGKHSGWERAAEAAGKEYERQVVRPLFKDGRASGSFADLARDEGERVVKAQIEAAIAKGPASRFPIIAVGQAGKTAAEWRVKGLLPPRGLAVLYGPSGSGKSFLALDMLAAIADGREWFGYRTSAAPAMLMALEGFDHFAKRLGALALEVSGAPDMRAVGGPFRLTDYEDESDLIAYILKHQGPGGVLCIDTLAAATAGMDENSAADMTGAIGALERIAAGIEGLVIVVAHSGKDASRGMRGHSSMFANVVAAIEVSGSSSEPRKWKARKVKDAQAGGVYPFALHVVELGADADGDAITSCIVAPETITTPESVRVEVARARAPGKGNMRVAWQRICELLQADPSGRVGLDNAISAVAEILTCEAKRKRERAETAVTALIAQNFIGHENGRVWLK